MLTLRLSHVLDVIRAVDEKQILLCGFGGRQSLHMPFLHRLEIPRNESIGDELLEDL